MSRHFSGTVMMRMAAMAKIGTTVTMAAKRFIGKYTRGEFRQSGNSIVGYSRRENCWFLFETSFKKAWHW
jgi:hypothetical protein